MKSSAMISRTLLLERFDQSGCGDLINLNSWLFSIIFIWRAEAGKKRRKTSLQEGGMSRPLSNYLDTAKTLKCLDPPKEWNSSAYFSILSEIKKNSRKCSGSACNFWQLQDSEGINENSRWKCMSF
jgi:hypothetical protein